MSLAPAVLTPAVRAVARWTFDGGSGWEQVRRRNTIATMLLGHPRGVAVLPAALGEVPAELLRPRNASGEVVLLYLHGGGFVTGGPRTHRALAGRLAQRLGADTYVARYRLAPEHPYPAAADDAFAAYRALLAAGWPATQILVAGDSAGGLLTLATALAARAAGLPLPAALGLICPAVDLTEHGLLALPWHSRDAVLTKPLMRRFLDAYAAEPAASPLHADLVGLPPIVVDAAGNDLLAGQARALVGRALAAGVSIHHTEHPGWWHDFHIMAGLLPQAGGALDAFADRLALHLRKGADIEAC